MNLNQIKIISEQIFENIYTGCSEIHVSKMVESYDNPAIFGFMNF